MKRATQFLSKRPISYYWNNTHPVSGARDTKAFVFEMTEKAQGYRLEMRNTVCELRRCRSKLSQAKIACFKTLWYKKTLENISELKENIISNHPDLKYQIQWLSAFSELLKLIRGGTINLCPEDLIDSPFENQPLSEVNIDTLEAWCCRELIALGSGSLDIFNRLADCERADSRPKPSRS